MTEITAKTLANLKPGAQLNCTAFRGLRARCLPSGIIKLGYRYSFAGSQREHNLGLLGAVTLDAAKTLAHEIAALVARGIDPRARQQVADARSRNTLDYIVGRYEADARARNMKTIDVVLRDYRRLVAPTFGNAVVYDLKRTAIDDLIQNVADTSGRGMAVKLNDELRAIFKYWEGKDDDFRSPAPRGWQAGPSRDRALDRDEIRDVYLAAIEHGGPFGAIVQLLLLTGCRRMEIGGLRLSEIKADDLRGRYLEIAGERMKMKKPHLVPITDMIAELLPNSDVVFNGYGKSKARLDAIIARRRAAEGRPAMPAWTLHDLRRTVRTTLAAIGVLDSVAERLLAHVQGGVAGIYNRYEYFAEKREALERWGAHVDAIVHGRSSNVVRMAG